MTDSFPRDLAISGTLHVVVAALIFLKAVFLPSEPIDLQSAIRVDIVGLPEKMPEMTTLPPKANEPIPAKPEPPAPKVETKTAEPTKPAAPTVPTKSKKELARDQKKALEKLRRQSALERIKEQLEEEKRAKRVAGIVKGNQVTEGNALTGIAKLNYQRYTEELRSKVHSQFNIPTWLAELNLRAQVQILVDESGVITKKILRLSSGNEIFDGAVIAAVDASSPLPAPPENLQSVLSSSGVVLTFPE